MTTRDFRFHVLCTKLSNYLSSSILNPRRSVKGRPCRWNEGESRESFSTKRTVLAPRNFRTLFQKLPRTVAEFFCRVDRNEDGTLATIHSYLSQDIVPNRETTSTRAIRAVHVSNLDNSDARKLTAFADQIYYNVRDGWGTSKLAELVILLGKYGSTVESRLIGSQLYMILIFRALITRYTNEQWFHNSLWEIK